MVSKVDTIREFVNELVLEQAKIQEKLNCIDSESYESRSKLFPKSIDGHSEKQKFEDQVQNLTK